MPQITFKSIIYPAVGFIVACLAVLYFFVWPQWEKYSAVQQQLQIAETANQNLSQTQAALAIFLESYNDNKQYQNTADLALPVKTENLAHLTSNIGDMATASGVLLSNFSITEPDAKEARVENSIQVVELNLSASGSYLAFRDFVLRLENNLRLMDLTHAVLKADETGSLQYQIKFNVYFQK
jgi:hypothetical protein